jgi:hypothetical protein
LPLASWAKKTSDLLKRFIWNFIFKLLSNFKIMNNRRNCHFK